MRHFLGFLALFMFSQLSKGQSASPYHPKPVQIENVHLKINRTLFFPAEYVYYAVDLNRGMVHEAEQLSKIVYVALQNSTGNVLSIQRIPIDRGNGQGQLFMDHLWPSGAYFLTVYTKKMLAKNPSDIQTQEIYLINPHTSVHELPVESDKTTQLLKTSEEAIFTPIQSLSTRSKVILTIKKQYSEWIKNGSYSLSVHQKIPYPHPDRNNNKIILTEPQEVPLNCADEVPGVHYSGRVTSFFSQKNIQFLAVSVFGSAEELIDVPVSEKGSWSMYLPLTLTGKSMAIKAMGDEIPSQTIIDFDELPHPPKSIFPKTFPGIQAYDTLWVKSKSVDTQIENAYQVFKPDTLQINHPRILWGIKNFRDFNLNEYNRFNTYRETIREIIPPLTVQTEKSGDYIKIKEPAPNGIQRPALVLVDGVLHEDHEYLLAQNPESVNIIRVANQVVWFADQWYHGIVYIEQKESAEQKIQLIPEQLLPLPKRKYYQHTHIKRSTQPDRRTELHWIPKLDLDNQGHFEFYTSDITGVFEVVLEGIDAAGMMHYFTDEFSVVPKTD
jgi:hypothetical protein